MLSQKLKPRHPQIHFYQVDERYVPATHPDSNQKMIKKAFENLKPSPISTGSATKAASTARHTASTPHSTPSSTHSYTSFPPFTHFHFFDTSLSIKDSLKKYSKELPKSPFDLTILGIGSDGHTASLFPNSKELNSKKTVIHSSMAHSASLPTRDKRSGMQALPIKDRLTLTFPPILKSKNLLVLLKNKPEISAELKSPTKSATNFPAHKLTKHKKINIFSLNKPLG